MSALANLKTALNGEFTTAVRNDFMAEQNVPRIDILTRATKAKGAQKRPAFTSSEYDTIVRKMRQWIKPDKNPNNAPRITEMNDRKVLLRDYFLILTNTGLRPGTETNGLLWQTFTAHGIVLLLKGIYEDANVSGASSHSGRRTVLTRLAERGISPFVMKELAGHKSIATTQRYVEVGEHQLRSALDKL